MKRMFRLLTVCLISSLPLYGCSKSGIFIYKNPVNAEVLSIDLTKGEITDGHLAWRLGSCDARYYCFKSTILEFAFPRSHENERSWSVESAHYVIKAENNVELLGKRLYAYRIEQTINEQKNWFLFSPKKGLIAMGPLSVPDRPIYLISGKCGFGAAEKC